MNKNRKKCYTTSNSVVTLAIVSRGLEREVFSIGQLLTAPTTHELFHQRAFISHLWTRHEQQQRRS